jgi:hypothetical protein
MLAFWRKQHTAPVRVQSDHWEAGMKDSIAAGPVPGRERRARASTPSLRLAAPAADNGRQRPGFVGRDGGLIPGRTHHRR